MQNLTVLAALACLTLGCEPNAGSEEPRGDAGVDIEQNPVSTDGSAPQIDARLPRADASAPLDVDASLAPSDASGPRADESDAALLLDAAVLPDGSLTPQPAALRWSPCDRTFECAVLPVPLDYQDPAAGTIELALKRSRASGARVGSLLVNPGGPGASAVDYLAGFAESAPAQLRERFDLVAFDPRGVGASSPLDCHSTIQERYAVDGSPDSEQEWRALFDAAQTFADECEQKHAALLPHLGTLNVARDMDRVRAALGEDKLNYLGISYGTSIGAWYAELFPDRVRALVLDAAVDLSLGPRELALQQAKSFELALGNYFAWCDVTGSCSWTYGEDPAVAFEELRAEVEREPLPAPNEDRDCGPGEYIVGVLSALYGGVDGWRELNEALADAVLGNGNRLVWLTDLYLERDQQSGSYPNEEETNAAVNCVDYPALSADQIRREVAAFEAAAPIFGVPTLGESALCTHWPVHGVARPAPTGKGAPPIVVIGTTGDPATPYGWAEAMASTLESGVLLTNVGDGHTGFDEGNACVDAAVLAYLIDGITPTDSCASVSASAPP